MARSEKAKYDKQYYVSDFETTAKPQYDIEGLTRVYLHYSENIYKDSDNHLGMDINDYWQWVCKPTKKPTHKIIYFHNLSFDILFLEYYLQSKKYRQTLERKPTGNYYTIIRDNFKSVYGLSIMVNGNLIEFRDSLKLLQSSVDGLPNERGLQKLKTFDYKKIRTETKLSDFDDDEILYVKIDVWKVKDTLKELLHLLGDYLTIASSSYNDWKGMYESKDKWAFKNDFPPLNEKQDLIIRKAYNGGIVMLNPKYKGKIINDEVLCYDINSLYPSRMRYDLLPYASPMIIYSSANLKKLKRLGYNLAVYVVIVNHMKIKKGFHPFISPTKHYTYSKKQDYPKEIKDTVFYWTNIDLEEVEKYYDIDYDIYYEESYAFKSKYDTFTSYIDKYNGMKMDASVKGLTFLRMFAKFRLNTPYGKFGTRIERFSCETIFDDESDLIDFEIHASESKQKFYLPMAVFITAYARRELINGIQSEAEGFIYADTDSLKIIKSKFKNSLKVHDEKLGYWKNEGVSIKSLFINNKQYILEKQKKNKETGLLEWKLERTIASLNRDNHHLVNFDNMQKGSVIKGGKKMRKHVNGGYIIVESDFTFT